MRVFIPYDVRNPKTRLEGLLTGTERADFARAMCRDVISTVRDADHEPHVLATGSVDVDVPATYDERSLTTAVNHILETKKTPLAIVMADLPLLTEPTLKRFLRITADVGIAPGLGGGTNGLVIRDGDFRVSYHEGSYRKHCSRAACDDLSAETFDSFQFAIDIDEPRDIAEVLLHSDGQTSEWLRRAGFELETTDDRTAIRREGAV